MTMKLFPKENVHGIFRGFSEGGMEFHAEIVLPYKNIFQSTPMHGQFLLVQLENENEAVLGRITSISSEGKLASSTGEDFGIRAVAEDRPVPEELREQYLKYRVDIRVLGVIRINGSGCVFVASHRRLPHVGSKVAFLSDQLLEEVAAHNIKGAELGFFALGEFIYAGTDQRLIKDSWMQVKSPKVIPKFDVADLLSRRSFVFARAGYGKSNLIKLLFSNLYKETPVIQKRGRSVPVGTLIFDPDGEYFWPDDKNRPGLCDVPELQDKIVLFTRRQGPSQFYRSFIASDIKIDIRQLRPSDVITIALSPEKQEQQNIRKLKALNDENWQRMVDLIYRDRNGASLADMKSIFGSEEMSDAEVIAARSNMTAVVTMLHDPSSQMMDMVVQALREGKICIVDVSQMRGTPSLVLSSLILQKIFDINQFEFTNAEPRTIPVIAVVEEAQSILSNKGSSGEGPYIAWIKEGRKYDLGAVLITQQPGSIPKEILSQGDNWFIFHLLSSGDLMALKNANAHYSDDILSSLLNEPIRGHCVFWSSSSSKSYPIPVRVMSFESLYKDLRDPNFDREPPSTYASQLRALFRRTLSSKHEAIKTTPVEGEEHNDAQEPSEGEIDGVTEDAMETYIQAAISTLNKNETFKEGVRRGIPYKGIVVALASELPSVWEESKRREVAFRRVHRTLDEIFGKDTWTVEKRPSKSNPMNITSWVVLKGKSKQSELI